MRDTTEIRGACGHDWLDFTCYAAGVLDDENEARAVEVQAVACAACWDELGGHLVVAGLIYEAVDLMNLSVMIVRNDWVRPCDSRRNGRRGRG